MLDGQQVQAAGTVKRRTRTADGWTYELDHLIFDPPRADSSILTQNPFFNHNFTNDASHRLLLRSAWNLSLPIGCRAVVQGTCRVPERAGNPGQFDAWSYYRARNIFFTMQADTPENVRKAKEHPFRLIDSVREKLAVLRERMWERSGEVFRESAGVLRAMLLGEKSSLEEDLARLFQDGGIAYVLTASALPVSLLTMALYRLLRKLRASFVLSAVLSGSVALCSLELTGGAPGAVRAAIMLLFWLGAQVTGQVNDRLNALGASALSVLLLRPRMLFDSTFLLSFGAILSLELLPPALEQLLPPGRLRKSSAAKRIIQAVSLQLGILPISLWVFFRLTPYGLLLGFLILPCMSLMLGFGLLAILTDLLGVGLSEVLMHLSVNGLFGGSLSGVFSAALQGCAGLKALAAAPVQTQVYLLVRLLRLEARLPGAVLVTGRPHPAQIIGYYMLLGLFVLYAKRKSSRRRTQQKRVQTSKTSLLLLCLLPILLTLRFRPAFRISFLDVGQGSCCLVEQGRTAFLFDAGSSSVQGVWEERIAPVLAFRGIRSLDAVFLSHSDSDHVNGIAQYLQEREGARAGGFPHPGQVRIRSVYLPAYASLETAIQTDAFSFSRNPSPADPNAIPSNFGSETEQPNSDSESIRQETCTMQDLVEWAKRSKIKVRYVAAGAGAQTGHLSLHMLGPAKERLTGEANQDGIVLLLTYRDLDVLLTGDLEKEGEEQFVRACQDYFASRRKGSVRRMILSAGHHGSKFATSRELLELLRPDLAVISCGKNNLYHHPAPETIARLDEAEIPHFCTTDYGQISVKWKGGSLLPAVWKKRL